MTFGTSLTKIPASILSFALMASVMGYAIAPDPAHADLTKRVYLTSGTSWTVPSDWTSSSNTIDAIGSGGDGSTSNAGGGGGAFARITNLSLTGGASVTYQIGAGSSDTVFNGTTVSCTVAPTPSLCADGGADASGSTNGAGGTTANSIGTTEYAGGTAVAGGGGGAAGPNGAGANGSAGTGGNGGNGSGGAGGAVGEADVGVCLTAGQTGGAGKEYDTIPGHGSGGGGGQGVQVLPGAGNDCTPGDGGQYGGGAGGATSETGAAGGGTGLIIITYTSTDTGSSSNAMIHIQGGKVQILGGRVLIQ